MPGCDIRPDRSRTPGTKQLSNTRRELKVMPPEKNR
jgi:hypothetical protein